jgi:hypothetical protein
MQGKSSDMKEKEGTNIQNEHVVSLGSCKDQTSWCIKQIGRPPMKFLFWKNISS